MVLSQTLLKRARPMFQKLSIQDQAAKWHGEHHKTDYLEIYG